MTQPTQTETQVFYPALRYEDAKAAVEWLQRVFGFEPHEVHEDDDGSVVHCEIGLGSGRVMFGSERPDAGYGSRDFSVRDPEGNLWSFGTYSPARR